LAGLIRPLARTPRAAQLGQPQQIGAPGTQASRAAVAPVQLEAEHPLVKIDLAIQARHRIVDCAERCGGVGYGHLAARLRDCVCHGCLLISGQARELLEEARAVFGDAVDPVVRDKIARISAELFAHGPAQSTLI
jgi:hypothetical protein